VRQGKTGHAEVIQFSYDPTQVSYASLLDFFFRMHDPTTVNRQGPDVGTNYRSVIFYHDETQKAIAEQALNEVKKAFNKPVATMLVAFTKFYEAEICHQDYLTKNPQEDCGNHFERSWDMIVMVSGGKYPKLSGGDNDAYGVTISAALHPGVAF
jgi:peptide-methionine (S)-S-oxide reductase